MSLSFTKRQLQTLGIAFRYHENVLMPSLADQLKKYGYDVQIGKEVDDCPTFVYGRGQIPILMVAHCDTVHTVGNDGQLANGLAYAISGGHAKLYAHRGNRRIGLGADDRAGVWGITELLYRGFRPHVLFTDGEESGAHGARNAAEVLEDEIKGKDIRFLIELDRMNDDDCVFYDCDNDDAVKFCESFGFKKDNGSFTDICVLMKKWGIAGVNLSVGYYRQHTSYETLHLDELMVTLRRVGKMLTSPPAQRLPFVDRWATTGGYNGYGSSVTADSYAAGYRRHQHPYSHNTSTAFCRVCSKDYDRKDLTLEVGDDGIHLGWKCINDCTAKAEECHYCAAQISRKDAMRRTMGKTIQWECKGSCLNPWNNGAPILRRDGYYHLRSGLESKKALALGFQMVYGATHNIEEEIKDMTEEDIVLLASDLWEKEKLSLDDYCPHCRRFTSIVLQNCMTCNGHVYIKAQSSLR